MPKCWPAIAVRLNRQAKSPSRHSVPTPPCFSAWKRPCSTSRAADCNSMTRPGAGARKAFPSTDWCGWAPRKKCRNVSSKRLRPASLASSSRLVWTWMESSNCWNMSAAALGEAKCSCGWMPTEPFPPVRPVRFCVGCTPMTCIPLNSPSVPDNGKTWRVCAVYPVCPSPWTKN